MLLSISAVSFVITFFAGCCVLIKSDVVIGIAMVALSFFYIFLFVLFTLRKCNNFVYMTEEKVWHKKESYEWDNVFITAKNIKWSEERGYRVYLYFSDHYFSDEEIRSKIIKRKGFYFNTTGKRTEYILQYYNKAVRLLDEPGWNKVSRLLHEHNKKYDDPREFL